MEKFERNRRKVKHCPCGKSNADGKFAPFAGKTKEGYCHSCCQTITNNESSFYKPFIYQKENQVIMMSKESINKSQLQTVANYFTEFIHSRFGRENLDLLVKNYNIGTSNKWHRATVFWYVDAKWEVRTGKIMLYNPTSGKRVQKPFPHISWAHTDIIKKENEIFKPCLFGEHLANEYPDKPIALVESEKTAIISSLYFPEFNWLATGGKGSLNYEKLKPLLSKRIVLFPDLDAYTEWRKYASNLSSNFNISVSEYLFDNATEIEKSEKFDLSDYLLRYNLDAFKVS